MKIYTGIGTRNLIIGNVDHKPKIVEKLKYISPLLKDWTLRSGAAMGMDTLFEQHHLGEKELYLPWRGFNGSDSPLYHISKQAEIIAKHFHPAPSKLTDAALKLMARNSYQVLGYDLKTPTDVVICWLPNRYKGGTSQAIRIADFHDIPVFNLFEEKEYKELLKFLENGGN